MSPHSTTSTSRSIRHEKADGSRLAVARVRAGMTRRGLADAVGVAPATVRTWEGGGVPIERLDALATATGVSRVFLEQDEPDPLEQNEIHFRSRRTASASSRAAAAGDGLVGIEFYRALARRLALPPVDVPVLSDVGGPEEAARVLRSAWTLGPGPLPNLVQLAEAHGVRVMGLEGRSADVDAFSLWRDRRPYIFLSRLKTPERSRFDLAHELGHLVLHAHEPYPTVESEKEADAFASEFLLPALSLQSAGRPGAGVDSILAAKLTWGVSAMAYVAGLRRAGVAGDSSATTMFRDLSARGYRRAESGSSMPWPRSRVFDAAREILGRSIASELAAETGLSPTDINTLTFGQLPAVARPGGGPSVPGPEPVGGDRRGSGLRLVVGGA
ncbi:XRE family transcriptional regulator [Dietzia aurantiaca]|uniref:XRE family transcriptional regulator n=1 Tax=Dietzia aurantiaca TaxID=983873 RepID=UPI0022A8E402|nr:XRE family transcriptional regulator [Dietzia aurantiaca]